MSQMRAENLRLSEALNASKTEEIRFEQRKNQYELEIIDLKRTAQLSRDHGGKSQAEVAQSRKELEDEITKGKALQQQVDRLRALVENLDQTKEELVRRLQSVNQEKIHEEQDKAVLSSDVQAYKRELLIKEQELSDLRRSVEQVDASKDELQAELDAKTEELQQARQQLDRQARDFSNVQHQMSVISGKEDGIQRRLFDRENEIKSLRQEVTHLRAQLEEATQIAQAKSVECQEFVEDIQTLTRENKFVNTEFAKATQANEQLRKHAEELIDRERLAQQSLRALELEKHDVLTNYRSACLESERLQEAVQQLSVENKTVFVQAQALEKEVYGCQMRLREVEQREQNCVSEIHTLERHIDHLTHQLELAQMAVREAREEREAIVADINSHRTLSYNLELTSQDMQRYVAQLENDKASLKQQALDWQREAEIAKKQIEMERQRAGELEKIISSERRQLHERDVGQSSVLRENDDLKGEVDRLTLRIQSKPPMLS